MADMRGGPNIPDDETLDAMTDQEYKEFKEDLWTYFQSPEWPSGSCIYIPRRKTVEEREKDKEESRKGGKLIKRFNEVSTQVYTRLAVELAKNSVGKTEEEKKILYEKFKEDAQIEINHLLENKGYIGQQDHNKKEEN